MLARWRQEKAFEKSLSKRKRSPRFVFYEGPPTANAGPALHHVLSRAFKDVVLRYKTMRGFLVERKAGWDTHGLPVELQIEKKLGLTSRKEIEEYGIARFNKQCRDSVWKFKGEWEKLTERIGFWLDTDHPYITYETPYIESLWWIIKQFADRKLLYRDYKVVPYCPRCGTSLSSHELAQGYKTVKDTSVYVSFRVVKGKAHIPVGTSLVAWTTTPWTLPGNVALAVNPKVSYALVKKDGKNFVVAKERVSQVFGENAEVVERFVGRELVGLTYEPLFRFGKPEEGKKVWEVVPADFVSMQEGTGIVHTAVAYGVDDFELGKKEGLAMLHLVDSEGKFTSDVAPWAGIRVMDANLSIIQHLKQSGHVLYQEEIEHEYPFCWRCSTPLLYYAKESWFVAMSRLKDQLLFNNSKVNWVPSHIKEGRFGSWLAEVKDWAFSRDRYWGTPLPIWECAKCGAHVVIGSLRELSERQVSQNTYFTMRHGHSERQELKGNIISCWPEKKELHLTEKGRREVRKAAQELKKKKIDVILTSDLMRTRETSEILGAELGIKPRIEKALREIDVGKLNGKPLNEVAAYWRRESQTPSEHYRLRFELSAPGGESYRDVEKRVYRLLLKLEKQYHGKNILLVSHQRVISLMEVAVRGLSRDEAAKYWKAHDPETAEWRKAEFHQLPYNDDMELDLHRPYIDSVVLPCDSCTKGEMRRVREVVDVWFDSGAMPFAQLHYPFENKAAINGKTWFPADYITEAIDQTRGWFYTLLAVATALGKGTPYKNVISLGHIMDENGEKMSKSKGNIVNPWEAVSRYGADAIRWHFYTASSPGDSKPFAEQEIQLTIRKFILTIWNSYLFYETYKPEGLRVSKSSHVLDRWILSRLQSLRNEMTLQMDTYDITGAARALERFVIDDVSLWYVRRSRSRFQNPSSQKELREAASTLRLVLEEISCLAAPFIPFLSDFMYRSLSQKQESVHWVRWPKEAGAYLNVKLEQEMERARDVVQRGLSQRSRHSIKVRQPLASLSSGERFSLEVAEIIAEELNVKKLIHLSSLGSDVRFDTVITPVLKAEGQLRELFRRIQDMRKRAGYKPSEKVELWYDGDSRLTTMIQENAESIRHQLRVADLRAGDRPKLVFDIEEEFTVDGNRLGLHMRRAA